MIYFDNAATTMHKPASVIEAVTRSFSYVGNAGRGAHGATLDADRMLFDTRLRLAQLFNGESPECFAFTSNATEGLNAAIHALIRPGDHVITTVCEHNSVLRPLYRKMENDGVSVDFLGLAPDQPQNYGILDDDALERYFKSHIKCADGRHTSEHMGKHMSEHTANHVSEHTANHVSEHTANHMSEHTANHVSTHTANHMISNTSQHAGAIIVTHASNLTGNLTDVKKYADFAKAHDLLLIVDGAQTAGCVPIDLQALGIDVFCFAGHKGLLGPQGTGGIYVRKGLSMTPFKVGGSGIHSFDHHQPAMMPEVLEAGTQNGHGLAGLHAALEFIAENGVDTLRQRQMQLCRTFIEEISDIEGIKLYGNPNLDHRVATVALNIGDCPSSWVADQLWEKAEIAVRAGAHCAPLMHEALGTKEQGAVRFSFSHANTMEEIHTAAQVLRDIADIL